MKLPKKKQRRKAGWRETDRLCRLCGKNITADKSLNKHHLSYSQNIVIPLHYICHNIVHGRMKYGCPFDKKYGKDLGAYFRAVEIFNLYQQYPLILTELIKKSEEVKNESGL